MNSALIAAVMVAAVPATASAGTYLGLGIGSAPEMSDSNQERLTADSRSGKLLLGTRMGRLSLEGAFGGYDVAITNGTSGVTMPFGDVYQASAALKLSLPLGNNFEAFGRAGVHHTWISPERDGNDASGNGLLVGLGFEYRLNAIIGQGSIFVDYQYNKATLEGDQFMGTRAFDASYRMFTLGLTIGL